MSAFDRYNSPRPHDLPRSEDFLPDQDESQGDGTVFKVTYDEYGDGYAETRESTLVKEGEHYEHWGYGFPTDPSISLDRYKQRLDWNHEYKGVNFLNNVAWGHFSHHLVARGILVPTSTRGKNVYRPTIFRDEGVPIYLHPGVDPERVNELRLAVWRIAAAEFANEEGGLPEDFDPTDRRVGESIGEAIDTTLLGEDFADLAAFVEAHRPTTS